MRHVLTINIIDVPEPPDCTADPLFSSGSGMTVIFSCCLVSIEIYSKRDKTCCPIWKFWGIVLIKECNIYKYTNIKLGNNP